LTRPFARAVAALVVIQLAGAAAAQPREEELRELRTRIDALKKELATAEGARAEAADGRAPDPADPLAPLPQQVLYDRARILTAWRQLDPDRRTLLFLEG